MWEKNFNFYIITNKLINKIQNTIITNMNIKFKKHYYKQIICIQVVVCTQV